MQVLVVAEQNAGSLRPASLSALSFAREVADHTGGGAAWLVLGHDVGQLARQAAEYAPVLLADAAPLAHPVAGLIG